MSAQPARAAAERRGSETEEEEAIEETTTGRTAGPARQRRHPDTKKAGAPTPTFSTALVAAVRVLLAG